MTQDPEHQKQDASLPPDRSHIATEQRHGASAALHRMGTVEIVALMNREDRRAAEAVSAAGAQITKFIEAVHTRFAAGGRMIYLGAGTSGRLGVLDASEMPPTFQIDPDRFVGIIAGGDRSLRQSSEGLEDDPSGAEPALAELTLTERDTVLGIAAGGTTPYVHGGLRAAHGEGCLTGLLTCSPIERRAYVDHPLVIKTGPELVTGSTRLKAGTATKLVLNMISTTLMIRSGRVYQNLMVDVKASNAKLRDRAARIITTLTGLDRPAAFALLERSGGETKAALVMHSRGVGAEDARTLLKQVGGRLDELLQP